MGNPRLGTHGLTIPAQDVVAISIQAGDHVVALYGWVWYRQEFRLVRRTIFNVPTGDDILVSDQVVVTGAYKGKLRLVVRC